MVKLDFDAALLENIIEKYETDHIKVVEIDGVSMRNFWLDRKKYREAQGLWNEVAKKKAILTRYGKKK